MLWCPLKFPERLKSSKRSKLLDSSLRTPSSLPQMSQLFTMLLLWKAHTERRGKSQHHPTIQPKACYSISGTYRVEDFSCNQNHWKQHGAATQQNWDSRAKNSVVHLTVISSYYFFWQFPLKRKKIQSYCHISRSTCVLHQSIVPA